MYNYNDLMNDWYRNTYDYKNLSNLNEYQMLDTNMKFTEHEVENVYLNRNTVPALYNPEEGYNKANMFTNLYNQYKNYQPKKVTAKNEKEDMLLKLNRVSFAAHDLNLYLDVYPNDDSIITLFNDYRKEANKLIMEYENKYGPLNISSNSIDDKTPFVWENEMWPWEGSD